jgi:chromosome segregation ATPase
MLISQSQETGTVRISCYLRTLLMLLEGTDTNKRHKSSHLQSGNTSATATSSQAIFVSENKKDPFMVEFEEHRRVLLGLREKETLVYRQEITILKKLLETKAQEKTASRQENELLKKQVAGKENEKQEASQQIERLQAQQNQKEEQTLVLRSQLAKTEKEAEKWKIKFRKLDAKVKNFVNGI